MMPFAIRLTLITLCAVVLSAASSFAQAPGYVRLKFVKAVVFSSSMRAASENTIQ